MICLEISVAVVALKHQNDVQHYSDSVSGAFTGKHLTFGLSYVRVN